jgi:hypothetical protein
MEFIYKVMQFSRFLTQKPKIQKFSYLPHPILGLLI